jgi:hypothetical protein
MYCPKCSQEQVSEEVRFCSRCGFSIAAVRELIVSNDALIAKGAQGEPRSCGQKAVRRGAWIMLASLAFTLFVGLMAAIDDDFAILLFLPFLGFVFGLLNVFYGAFLADKRALKRAAAKSQLVSMMPGQPAPAARVELPPARMAPIESFSSKRGETAEMVQPPPSVTENTTRLLEDESDVRRAK